MVGLDIGVVYKQEFVAVVGHGNEGARGGGIDGEVVGFGAIEDIGGEKGFEKSDVTVIVAFSVGGDAVVIGKF